MSKFLELFGSPLQLLSLLILSHTLYIFNSFQRFLSNVFKVTKFPFILDKRTSDALTQYFSFLKNTPKV